MVCYTAYILTPYNYCWVNKLNFKIFILNIKTKKMLAYLNNAYVLYNIINI